MTNEEILKNFRINKKGCLEQLYFNNKGYIHQIADEFSRNYGEEVEDLEHEGFFGLCEACERYDSSKGANFLTFATYHIKNSMRKYIHNQALLRVPEHYYEKFAKYKKARQSYIDTYKQEPTRQELFLFSGISPDEQAEIEKLFKPVKSLDMPIKEDEELYLGDTVASDSDIENEVIEKAYIQERKDYISSLINESLTDKEKAVINDLYYKQLTLNQTADHNNITYATTRQINQKSLRKLNKNGSVKLKVYFKDISSTPYHGSLTTFKLTQTSIVERIVLKAY